VKPDNEVQIIQSIIGAGIGREELRDEIFVQCMRQATNNPTAESTERVWLLICLAIVAFQPSKLLHKVTRKTLFRLTLPRDDAADLAHSSRTADFRLQYFVSFLRKNLQCEGKLKQYVQWCYDNCKNTKVSCRQYPPSTVEIAVRPRPFNTFLSPVVPSFLSRPQAMRRLGTIVCRFFFLDGRTKAIDIHPTDTASDAVYKLADKLCLKSIDGWSIYQSRSDGEEHVRAHHYLYDVIAAWQSYVYFFYYARPTTPVASLPVVFRRPYTVRAPPQSIQLCVVRRKQQVKQTTQTSSFPSLSRRSSNATLTSGENRFIFKRRLFRHSREISQDPIEVNLLYAQAVYSVVKVNRTAAAVGFGARTRSGVDDGTERFCNTRRRFSATISRLVKKWPSSWPDYNVRCRSAIPRSRLWNITRTSRTTFHSG